MVIPERDARIDVAVVNGSLHGFEIKSDRDTLRRLPAQRDAYNALFDEVTLITGDRHIEKAMAIIPDWWGVWRVSGPAHRIQIERLHTPSVNPSPDPRLILRLLSRKEIESIVMAHQLCFRANGYYLYELHGMLVDALTAAGLRQSVRCVIKQRRAVARRPSSYGG
jgi:hypothetical protein